jgi:hypothetical protein
MSIFLATVGALEGLWAVLAIGIGSFAGLFAAYGLSCLWERIANARCARRQ